MLTTVFTEIGLIYLSIKVNYCSSSFLLFVNLYSIHSIKSLNFKIEVEIDDLKML